MKSRRQSERTVAAGAVLLLLLILALTVYDVFYAPNTFRGRDEIVVTIPRGLTFHSIVDTLRSAGVIRSGSTLIMAGRLIGWTESIKTGRYLFRSGVSNYDILSDLHAGKSRLIANVTIPEGTRMTAVADILERQLGIDREKFLADCRDTGFIRSLGVDAPSLEGYLLPDTYQFYWQTDEREIISRLVGEFHSFFNEALRQRAVSMHRSVNEILTMASIVEWEAVHDNERPLIAGLYYNRLRRGMKLEADPTLRYVLDSTQRILYKDFKINSPYNTYLHYGLPPGPINNPGKKSILAALSPAFTGYLYFVADGAGGHVFSQTYDQHMRAVQRYRRLRNQRTTISNSR